MGNGHSDLGHRMGVPKMLTWSINSLGEQAHSEHKLTWSTLSLGEQAHLEHTLSWSIHSLGAHAHLENLPHLEDYNSVDHTFNITVYHEMLATTQ